LAGTSNLQNQPTGFPQLMKLMVAKAERAEVEKEAASSARKALVPRLNAECFNFPDPRRN
jgi:hypothetical protein